MSETRKMQAGFFAKLINIILNECKNRKMSFFNIAAKCMTPAFLRHLNVIIGISFVTNLSQAYLRCHDVFKSYDYRNNDNAWII